MNIVKQVSKLKSNKLNNGKSIYSTKKEIFDKENINKITLFVVCLFVLVFIESHMVT